MLSATDNVHSPAKGGHMPSGKRTVRDFKNKVKPGIFIINGASRRPRSDRHWAFWHKLNGITTTRCTKTMAQVPDMDAEVELSDKEWAELEAEFNSL